MIFVLVFREELLTLVSEIAILAHNLIKDIFVLKAILKSATMFVGLRIRQILTL